MLKRFALVVLLLAVMAGTGFSQTFTGLIDGYYGYNFNKPASRTNAFRAFDINENEFSLNYAELAIEKKPAPVGYRFDIGFGDTARIVNSVEPSATFYQHIQQAYITTGKGKWTVDFGKFVTSAGAEVIETKDNWNYSRGILFTWAIPFYHFGIRTAVAPSDKVSFGAQVVNGWNNVKDNNAPKTVVLTSTLKPGKLTWVNNYIIGKEITYTRNLYDSIATVALTKEFSVMANYDYGMDRLAAVGPGVGRRARWQGIALYAQATPVSWFKFTPRWEWFNDPQGFMTGAPETLKEFTTTAEFISKDNLALWAEYRRDWALNTNGVSTPLPTFAKVINGAPNFSDNQTTLTLGLTYTFSKEVK